MACRLCGNSGEYGSKGYWVYCSCEKGQYRFKKENETQTSGYKKKGGEK